MKTGTTTLNVHITEVTISFKTPGASTSTKLVLTNARMLPVAHTEMPIRGKAVADKIEELLAAIEEEVAQQLFSTQAAGGYTPPNTIDTANASTVPAGIAENLDDGVPQI